MIFFWGTLLSKGGYAIQRRRCFSRGHRLLSRLSHLSSRGRLLLLRGASALLGHICYPWAGIIYRGTFLPKICLCHPGDLFIIGAHSAVEGALLLSRGAVALPLARLCYPGAPLLFWEAPFAIQGRRCSSRGWRPSAVQGRLLPFRGRLFSPEGASRLLRLC